MDEDTLKPSISNLAFGVMQSMTHCNRRWRTRNFQIISSRSGLKTEGVLYGFIAKKENAHQLKR